MFSKIEILNLVESLAQMDKEDIEQFTKLLNSKYPEVASTVEFSLYVESMENSFDKVTC
jgi:hypothetical protein